VFWKAVISGLSIFQYGDVWLVLFFYISAHIGLLLLIGGIGSKNESAGCLSYFIIGGIGEAALNSLLIAFLMYYMLGIPEIVSIAIIYKMLWELIKVGVLAAIVTLLITLIPIIGSFIANSPGLINFIQGLIIFRILASDFVSGMLTHYDATGSVYPSLLQLLGFFVIAAVLTWIITFIFALILEQLKMIEEDSILILILAPLISVLSGLIPLFMYARFVSLALRRAIGV
jgi:hypothetical protein